MAVTISLYNHTPKLFANGDVDLGALKFMLTDEHSFSAADTDLSGISGDEVSGSGWDAGGEAISGAAVTVTGTNDAKLDGDDITVTATGGAISADGGVIYDNTGDYPLAYVAFGETKTADEGADFKITWNAGGIITWTNAA